MRILSFSAKTGHEGSRSARQRNRCCVAARRKAERLSCELTQWRSKEGIDFCVDYAAGVEQIQGQTLAEERDAGIFGWGSGPEVVWAGCELEVIWSKEMRVGFER